MKGYVRLLIAAGCGVCAVPAMALDVLRSHDDMLAPARLLLFAIAVAIYLLPVALAWYRGCKATVWIALVNIFLGWSIVGWFAALGWAASGKAREAPMMAAPSPSH